MSGRCRNCSSDDLELEFDGDSYCSEFCAEVCAGYWSRDSDE